MLELNDAPVNMDVTGYVKSVIFLNMDPKSCCAQTNAWFCMYCINVSVQVEGLTMAHWRALTVIRLTLRSSA